MKLKEFPELKKHLLKTYEILSRNILKSTYLTSTQKQAIFLALKNSKKLSEIESLLPKNLGSEVNLYNTITQLYTLINDPKHNDFIKKENAYPANLGDSAKQQLLREISGDAKAHPPKGGLLFQRIEDDLAIIAPAIKTQQELEENNRHFKKVILAQLLTPPLSVTPKPLESNSFSKPVVQQPASIDSPIATLEALQPEALNRLFTKAALEGKNLAQLRVLLKNNKIINKLTMESLIEITTRLPDLYPLLAARIFLSPWNSTPVDRYILIKFMLSHIDKFTLEQHKRLIRYLIPLIEQPSRELHILALSNQEFALLLIDYPGWEKAVIAPANLLQVLSKKYLSVKNEIECSSDLKDLMSKAKKLELISLPKHLPPNYFKLRIGVIGDFQVGKSSLLQAFSNNNYDPVNQMYVQVNIKFSHSVINAAITEVHFPKPNQAIDFRYLNGMHLYLLTLDANRPEKFNVLSNWVSEISYYVKNFDSTPCILVGTKADTVDPKKNSSPYTLEELAQSLGWYYIETSAKQGKNIQETLQLSATVALNSLFLAEQQTQTASNQSSSLWNFFNAPIQTIAKSFNSGMPQTSMAITNTPFPTSQHVGGAAKPNL